MRIALAVALLTLATRAASAQEATPRFALEVGLGAAGVATETDGTQISRAQSVGLGVRIGRRSWLVLEGTTQGTNQRPRTDDLRVVQTGSPPITDVQVVREPDMFSTTTLMAGLRLPIGGAIYARPAAGVGRHAFASYRVGATTVESAETSHEWGMAAGLALGSAVRIASFRTTLEAAALWSGGEDSSGARRVFALRLVQRLPF